MTNRKFFLNETKNQPLYQLQWKYESNPDCRNRRPQMNEKKLWNGIFNVTSVGIF